jgi:hypothetical protein
MLSLVFDAMTTPAAANPELLPTASWQFDLPNLWESAQTLLNQIYAPQPNQDTDLLQQLAFVPGLKELLMLRQVHALEHGTVWVLSNQYPAIGLNDPNATADNEQLGGMSTDQGFYLYGVVERSQVERAARQALRRLTRGEWQLAIHPRCGTNLSVEILLTSGLFLGSQVLLPKGPIEQVLGLGLAATTAAQLAPEIGMFIQRHLATAIPFNLEIVGVSAVTDLSGSPAHFVQVRWQE